MSRDETLARNELYAAIDSGIPRASYVKTILGNVLVTVWDNFLNKPVEVILKGNPKNKEKDAIVSVFSDREKAFFERANAILFKKGLVIPYTMPTDVKPEKTIEQATDEELTDIVNSKFLKLQNHLSQIESIPVLFRMISIAEELEKSEKITGAIQKRISELQAKEYAPKNANEPVVEE